MENQYNKCDIELETFETNGKKQLKQYDKYSFFLFVFIFFASALAFCLFSFLFAGIFQCLKSLFFSSQGPSLSVVRPNIASLISILITFIISLTLYRNRESDYNSAILNSKSLKYIKIKTLEKHEKKVKGLSNLFALLFIGGSIALIILFINKTSNDFTPVSFTNTLLYIYSRYSLVAGLASVGGALMIRSEELVQHSEKQFNCSKCGHCFCMTVTDSKYFDTIKSTEKVVDKIGFQGPKRHTLATITDKESGATLEIYHKEHAHFIKESREIEKPQNRYVTSYICEICGGTDTRTPYKL